MITQVLTIAGSDCSGGAGIQADLKALSANGTYAMSVVTSITAQNTANITAIHHLPTTIIEAQIDAIFDDFTVSTVKTGMLATTDIIEAVSRKLAHHEIAHLVVDPVMVSKSGHSLLQPDAIDILKSHLIPHAFLLTPNIQEAEILANMPIRTLADARTAAKVIHQLGCRHVLIKGGHLLERPATDLLYDGRFFRMYQGDYIDTPHTHGTGCTYASAIAAHLARGALLPDAIDTAKTYLTEAIRHGLSIGHGHGPTHHFYFLDSPTSR
ncbi:MAG: bifunctional hydroxymethylpyrimidine kinase/phosphomethylpyrimidine kinase [Nitrospirales bacterium]|nr:bifunctional hydroxymethylpyrimidine kinase/phosphomethylpyrimidine kinase [Nitrospirales bacterium]